MADGRDAIAASYCRSTLREVDGSEAVPVTLEVGHLAKGGVGEYEPAIEFVAPPRQRGWVRLDPPPIGGQRVLLQVHQPIEARAIEDTRAKVA